MSVIVGDCLLHMGTMKSDTVDLVLTSPPYDDLRTYEGYRFDFQSVAREISRVMKPGAVCVWIVGDATVKGSETGSSFQQALFFKEECGLNLHDTMIWDKENFTAVGALVSRYAPVFEYMFILSKGSPSVFNPIKDRPNKHAGTKFHGTVRQKDGSTKPVANQWKEIPPFGQRHNIWRISPVKQRGEGCHPAPFPLQLAIDHILSWTNPGALVFDPFLGSGTTAVAAIQTKREWLGTEISPLYADMAVKRIAESQGETDYFFMAP